MRTMNGNLKDLDNELLSWIERAVDYEFLVITHDKAKWDLK